MNKKSVREILGEGLSLLSRKEAQELADQIGEAVLCEEAWPKEVTGREKKGIINSSNWTQFEEAVLCRPGKFPVRVPMRYRANWR